MTSPSLPVLPLAESVLGRLAALLRLDPAALARDALEVAAIWVLAWVAMRVVKLLARRIVALADDGDDSVLSAQEKRAQTIAQLFRSVGRLAIVALAILLTLNQFIDIGPLLAGAGILGLAVSFGAQSLVKDVIAGFFILLENQFVVGDVIEAAGKTGTVERMTLRLVALRDVRGELHFVPNGQITTVSNMTRSWSRAVVDVGVAYGTDVDRALEVLRDESAAFAVDPAWAPRLDGTPEVKGVEGFTDNAVTLRVLVRTRPGEQWECAREFRRRLKKRLDAEGIEIPFPQRTVHHRYEGAPPSAASAAEGD